MQILAFLQIAIGIRRTFLVQSDPDDPLISGPNGRTTAAVDVPTAQLLADFEILFESYWRYPSRLLDDKVSAESFRALCDLPGFILLVREVKLLTYSDYDPAATSTGRPVAFHPSVVAAAGWVLSRASMTVAARSGAAASQTTASGSSLSVGMAGVVYEQQVVSLDLSGGDAFLRLGNGYEWSAAAFSCLFTFIYLYFNNTSI